MPSQRDSETHTPPRSSERREYDTIHKCRFYNAFDSKQKGDSLRQICKKPDINIPPSTGHRWLTERDILGSKALRRTRKTSKRLGRKYKVSAATLAPLLDESNPLNTKPYETQQSFNEYIHMEYNLYSYPFIFIDLYSYVFITNEYTYIHDVTGINKAHPHYHHPFHYYASSLPSQLLPSPP